MLNNLYRKLHILFASSVMLIITLVISFVVANTVHTEKINESTLFQRLTTLLIYQVESASSDMDKELKAYEESYHIFSLISDTKGNTIYQSNFPFPTPTDNLLHDVEKQISTQPLSQTENSTTSQGGFLEIRGTHHDTYFVIPATIRTANDTVYHATFFYQTASLTDILQKTLPIYLLIWFLACIVVIVLTRYLLKKSFAPTERILQSQKDFVATASHELKSPLAVMISNTDMLLDNVSLNEQARQAVQTIDFECMRLSRLVKDMLLLASSDAKTWTLHKSTINVDTLLITLYETYEPVCMKQNLELKLHLSEESYPAMLTDKDRLFQILCVFMDNAIQHSKNNSLIEIEVIATEKNIAFSVADHGQGISDEDKQYIFDRFYSGDKSHTNKSNFGLGLSIAKELIQYLNSNINNKFEFELNLNHNTEQITIIGDERLLCRAIQNIISNSINHNENGCIISVRLEINGNNLELVISDNGKGISEKELQKIQSTPHYLQSTDNRLDLRHGLGLLLVKEIISIHKGTVSISSALNKGFSTTISLPINNQ